LIGLQEPKTQRLSLESSKISQIIFLFVLKILSHNTEFTKLRNMLVSELQLSCYCSKDSLFQKQ